MAIEYHISPKTIWVVVIAHQYGNNASAYLTEEKAWTGLRAFVKEWWTSVMGDQLPNDPEIDKDDVQTYFDANADQEGYEMYQLEIE